mgnify:FL=1
MDDKYLDVLKSISNRVDASLKQSQELQRQREKTKMMTNNAPRPVKPKSSGTVMSKNVQRSVTPPPRAAQVMKPRNKTFFDLVEKSRALDKRIKQSRKDGRDVKDRLQDLEEFSKISEEMENID